MHDDADELVAELLNRCYLVRYYRRHCQRERRAAALRALGDTCRRAFTSGADVERLLGALIDGLSPRERDF